MTCLLEWHPQSTHVDIWRNTTSFKLIRCSNQDSCESTDDSLIVRMVFKHYKEVNCTE